MPADRKVSDPSNEDIAALSAQYLADIERWVIGEIETKNTII
ncbi:hypothetical protein K3495_g5200 [Podosphaera aphanis]|nr:hypothetical protein K3495_g5200 [Podosphaera aphanis]